MLYENTDDFTVPNTDDFNLKEDDKDNRGTKLFDDISKEKIEKAEEFFYKLEGMIELEDDTDMCEIFKDNEGLEGKVYNTLR